MTHLGEPLTEKHAAWHWLFFSGLLNTQIKQENNVISQTQTLWIQGMRVTPVNAMLQFIICVQWDNTSHIYSHSQSWTEASVTWKKEIEGNECLWRKRVEDNIFNSWNYLSVHTALIDLANYNVVQFKSFHVDSSRWCKAFMTVCFHRITTWNHISDLALLLLHQVMFTFWKRFTFIVAINKMLQL